MQGETNGTRSLTRRSALGALGAAGALAAAAAVAAPVTALAATSGSCGTGVTWKLSSGTLTVSGSGAMSDYEYGTQPWFGSADSITKVVVGSGVTHIGDCAFEDLTYVSSVSIASTVQTIGDSAFSFIGDYRAGTSKLAEVTIPEGVTSIGDYAFYHVCGLASVSLPGTLTSIGKWAFGYDGVCYESELTSITLPYGLQSIGVGAFVYAALESVVIPPTVTELGAGAFQGCGSLSSVTFEGDAPTIFDDDGFCGEWMGFDDDVPYATSIFLGCASTVHYYTNTSGWTASCMDSFSCDVGENTPDLTWVGSIGIYRLYNQYSGEHHYTSSINEYTTLVGLGWTYEGVAWGAPEDGVFVYRLYNQYSGDHHYSTDVNERDTLVDLGWTYEGVGWCSDGSSGTPVYRLYNPYASSFYHHYTTDANECATLVALGWEDEGVGWYGL